jgi:hypothetical protein
MLKPSSLLDISAHDKLILAASAGDCIKPIAMKIREIENQRDVGIQYLLNRCDLKEAITDRGDTVFARQPCDLPRRVRVV